MSTSSRFDGLPTFTAEVGGRTVEVFAPRTPVGGEEVAVHTVKVGERLDHVALRWYRDPLQSWRILDANEAPEPGALEVPGRRLRILRADR